LRASLLQDAKSTYTDRCEIEEGWSCTGSPSNCSGICGNGIITLGEECDDGNVADSEGCSSQCRVEVGWSCAGKPSVCTMLPVPPTLVNETDEELVLGLSIALPVLCVVLVGVAIIAILLRRRYKRNKRILRMPDFTLVPYGSDATQPLSRSIGNELREKLNLLEKMLIEDPNRVLVGSLFEMTQVKNFFSRILVGCILKFNKRQRNRINWQNH
jgi:cysteine-rich repeat protein